MATPASVSNSKTVTQAAAPHLPASLLTTLLSIAPENLTVAQFHQIGDALKRYSGSGNPAAVLGSILK